MKKTSASKPSTNGSNGSKTGTPTTDTAGAATKKVSTKTAKPKPAPAIKAAAKTTKPAKQPLPDIAPPLPPPTLFQQLTVGRPVTDKQIYSLAVNNKLVKLVVAKGVGVAPPSNPSAGLFKEEPRLQFVVIVKMKDSVGTSISVMTHDESVARALYGPPGLKFLGGDPTGALWTDARSSTHVGRPCPPDTSEVKALQLAAEYAAELISKMN